MRTTVSASIAILQLLCAVQPASAASVLLEDMGTNGNAMDYVKENNVLTPLGDGLWHPEMPLTRMDLITSIVRNVYKEDINDNCFKEIAAESSADYTHLFRDISRSSVHAKEVCVAMFVGILQGKPDGSLKPEQSANLVETAKMVSKAYGIAPFQGLKQDAGVPWHEPFWYALARRNAIPKTVASRSSTLTRGEFADIMYNLRTDKPIIGFRETSTKVVSMTEVETTVPTMQTPTVKADDTSSTVQTPIVLSERAQMMHVRREARLENRLSRIAKVSETVQVVLEPKVHPVPLVY